MLDKDKFLKEIKAEALSRAEVLLNTAKNEKAESLKALDKELAESVDSERQKTEAGVGLILSRRLADARIATPKIILTAKQKAVDAAYNKATQKILSMSDAEYKGFISGLITKYAEDGDKVVFAECDKKRIPNDFFKTVSTKLTVSGKTHSGQGGVILEGKKCDKNLTIEALMKVVREETESDVANVLFL